MCGLALLYSNRAMPREAMHAAVGAMCARMRRRGPDAEAFWGSDELVLGHRRLAILDLDARSNQPMVSACGRYVIVFNGEIYNFRELRGELEARGDVFRTTSDTEVLLALYARQGPEMLARLRGMFALAIWDCAEKRLFLARDPYGIKPLYYARSAQGVLVASQVKALLASGLVSREPDALGQAGFWLLGSVPEPRTWYRDIRMLPAGHWAYLSADGAIEPHGYRDIADNWRDAPACKLDDAQIRELAREALRESVRAHLVADVPVGVFLSGGIDSGSLAALMKQAGVNQLKGVTLSFAEFAGQQGDEAPDAARIAAQFGIEHHVRRVTREEFEADLPRLLDAMDQPSVDGINTWYASKAVAELGLKVVVSGVGGDELFQGYSSFDQLPRLVRNWRRASAVPGVLPLARSVSAWQARRSGKPRWKLLPQLAGSMPGAWFLRRGVFAPEQLPALMGDVLAREALGGVDPERMVEAMTGAQPADLRLALGQIESMTYLRNQLLRDSDWASMDHSVELRTPLVDIELLESLRPVLAAMPRYPGKELLAQAPAPAMSDDLLNRPKTGFSIPVKQWIAEKIDGGSWENVLAHAYAAWQPREAA